MNSKKNKEKSIRIKRKKNQKRHNYCHRMDNLTEKQK